VNASINGNSPESIIPFIHHRTAPQSSLNRGGIIREIVELETVSSNVLVNENYTEVSL